jgi:adenylate cyclase
MTEAMGASSRSAPARSKAASRLGHLVDRLLSIGAYAEEPENQRARRRIMMAAIWISTILTTPFIGADFSAGYTWSAVTSACIPVATAGVLITLHLRPRWYVGLINVLLGTVSAVLIAQTALFGGLYGSSLIVMFGLSIALAALLALGLGPAIWWFAAFVASVVVAVVIAGRIDPLYLRPDAETQAAFALIATGIVAFVITLYFVRQRDRYERRSDDLLHNILPDEIASRLKDAPAMIADTFESVSVLFADVVGFTPMSAGMPASELVSLLDEVFSVFDGFAAELGLEKIKTVGDAYMVAAGVPAPRPDHAEAISRLALRMRDHTASVDFRGHAIRIRVGINSGPVVAGIIGKQKFAYDLWGDTVNTASRMESSGVPGAIQLTPATHELIRARFICQPRGTIPVKGKGEMETFLLVSARTDP